MISIKIFHENKIVLNTLKLAVFILFYFMNIISFSLPFSAKNIYFKHILRTN